MKAVVAASDVLDVVAVLNPEFTQTASPLSDTAERSEFFSMDGLADLLLEMLEHLPDRTLAPSGARARTEGRDLCASELGREFVQVLPGRPLGRQRVELVP